MTRAEMTEIFAVLMIAYPNAEMFKAANKQALMEKLAPTITLWATCLSDVDFWTAQNAVVKLCRTCKFPPTIADLKEQTDAVVREVTDEINAAWNVLKLHQSIGETWEEAYSNFQDGCRIKKVIDAMGGPSALTVKRKTMMGDGTSKEYKIANWDGFRQTYERMLRQNPVGLPGGNGEQKRLK